MFQKGMKNRLLALTLAVSVAFSGPMTLISNATEEEEIKQLEEKHEEAEHQLEDANRKKAETEKQLEDTSQKRIQKEQEAVDLQEDVAVAQAQVDATASELNTLYSRISTTSAQIETTQAGIEDLKRQIAETEAQRMAQYNRLKSRIAYNYEISAGKNLFTAFLESGTFADYLKRVDYMWTAAQYDQKIIEEYKAVEKTLEQQAMQLASSEDELESFKSELAATQNELYSVLGLQVATANQTSGQLMAAIDQIGAYDEEIQETQDQIENYDEEIADLENQMAELEQQQAAAQAALAKRIAEEQERERKEAEARAAEEARKKAEEEIRKRVEAEVRQKAEEEARKKAEEAAQAAFEEAKAQAEANGTEAPAEPEPIGDITLDEAAISAQIEARVQSELEGMSFEGTYEVYEDTSGPYAADETEIILLAATIQAEAGNQSYTGKLAVGSVIMNRVKSSKFPNSIYGVITQENQFEPWRKGIVTKFIEAGPNETCMEIARAVCGGSRNGNWLFFMTPKWAEYYGITGYTTIGGHAFFYKWGAN